MQEDIAAHDEHVGRAYIDQIRRAEYMIGMQLPPDAQAAAEGMRRKLNSALRLLSHDLYSTKTHFVLELLQNADDNAYAPAVSPEIHIQLTPTTLRVWNNELGFNKQNVRALCSVGESTKSKRIGFIGEKGIGFKSVFQVSDAPQIHSNGFHFRFDMSNPEDHLGYVVPHWTDPGESVAPKGTTIILPAKAGEAFTDSVLAELDARLLLFLRKLRRIELHKPNEQVSLRRSDDSGFVVLQIERSNGHGTPSRSEQRYLRVAQNVPMETAPDEKRPQILESEIILAFPVEESGRALAKPDCATFAFLPIRLFGFRFCVQADFLLSSAREDIQTARPWNIALRDAIAPAFVASLDHFRERPHLARTFLQFVPRETEITNAFFAPIVKQTIAALTDTACILCATGTWRKPGDVILASTAFQRLVPADQAWAIFGKDYPAHDLDVDQATLKTLGCVTLYIADVVKLFSHHGEWVLQQGKAWLARFFHFLATLNRQDLLDAKIRESNCLPVGDGTLKAPHDRKVFYPLARGKKFGFEKELLILDEEFLEAILSEEGDIKSLLHDLGVRMPEPYSLIIDHILPAHQGDRWKESDFAALIGHVRYVKTMLGDYLSAAAESGVAAATAIAALRNGLRLKTKKHEDGKWYFNSPGELYLSTEYDPDFDIETLVGETLDAYRLTSADYLPTKLKKLDASDTATELAEWREFFDQLGVNPSPRVVGDTNSSCSSELEHLLQSESQSVRRKTLECLDRQWSRYASRATYASSAKHQAPRYYTRFAMSLRGTVAPTKQKRSVPLSEAYCSSDEVREVFGSSPTYVDAELINASFLDTCGIVHRVNIDACIKRLKQLKKDGRASVGAVRPLYRYVDQIFERDPSKIREAFKEHALIFTRSDESPWRRPDEVVWSSQGEFLNAHFPQLHGQYQDSHGFFVRRLGVPNELSVGAAVGVLPLLSTSGLSPEVQAAEALRIYTRASRELGSLQDGRRPAWLTAFDSLPVYLNHRGEMVMCDGALYADDQPTTSALFAGRAEISFLAVPPTRLPQIRVLLETAEVPLVSEHLVVDLQDPVSGHLNVALTSRVRERYRYIARLVYGQSHTAFERARENGIWRRLSSLKVIDVDVLTIRATLSDITETTQGEVVISGDTAFARVGAKAIADRLAREICLMLKVPITLVDGFSRVLRDSDVSEVEEYLEVKGVPELPEDEEAQLTIEHVAQSAGAVSSETIEPNLEEVPPAGDEPDSTLAVAPEAPTMGSVEPASIPLGTLSPESGREPKSSSAGSAGSGFGGDSGERPHTPGADKLLAKSPDATKTGESPSANGSTPRPSAEWTGAARKPEGGRRKTRSRAAEAGGRLLSYAEPAKEGIESPNATQNKDQASERDGIAQAAVDYFLETQRANWASLQEMPPYNKGFDIRGVAHDGSEHFIEVKGQSARWTEAGIAMTPSELLCAADNREQYWLCVVEHATQPGNQILHLVNNPFGKADQFRFDSGWKTVASTETSTRLTPAPGLYIDMLGIGFGTIISVKKAGSMFCKIHVHLTDGRQVFKVFDPAKMRLSTGT